MLTPASIIKRLGGNKAVADHLGLERTAVQRWSYDGDKGTGGRIPMKHWAKLLKLGATLGVSITIDDLLPPAIKKAERHNERAA